MAVFKSKGYTATKMTEIIAEADASTGSIYHHFGGKEELFAACHLRLRDEIRELVGIDPEADLPEPGHWEKAYLWAVWTHREDAAVFLSMDVPPNFDPVESVARYYCQFLGRRSARLLGAIVVEAMKLVVDSSADEATVLIDHVAEVISAAEQLSRTDF